MARFIPRTLRGQMPAKDGTPRRPARRRPGATRSQPARSTDDRRYDEPPVPADPPADPAESSTDERRTDEPSTLDEPFHLPPIAVERTATGSVESESTGFADAETGGAESTGADSDGDPSGRRDGARRPSPRPRPGRATTSGTDAAGDRRRRPSPRPKPSRATGDADRASDDADRASDDMDRGSDADGATPAKPEKARPTRPPVKAPARPSSGSRGGKKPSRGKPGKSGPTGKSGKAALARRRRAERSLKRTHRAIAILGLLAVLALAAGGGAWWIHQRDGAVDQARDHAVSAAQAAAPALLSYDYRTFDASVRRAKPYLGGSFAKKYAKTTASLKHYAVKQKAILTARVSATSVVSARSDQVVLLLYVDQYKQNSTITGQKVDQNRVVLTMTPIAGKWKVTKVTAI
ncbi:hypothetical protein AB0I55_24440 [Actinocatenispora sera]|uniref:hypothetical protein n=1 Tax=Actinocatenispora sera TaxID=390989 RepID=UPI0033D8D1FD